jgi:REP element-mobilizing transposase RayT
MTDEAVWALRCATVMPDHLHLLLALGGRLTISQCISRLKVRTKSALLERKATWQANFYDHRLRADDSIEATIRYIWMNPYKGALIPTGEIWPWFYCRQEEWEWFLGLTDLGHPFPEWLL